MMPHNADAHETQKFDAMAVRWWDLEGPCAPLHAINPLRLQFILDHASVAQKTVLDVGCGGGILAESLAAHGASVTGIDMGESVLTTARLHAQASQLDIVYQQTTVESWAETHPQHYDVVTCMEMLEHVPDPTSVVKACAALVKPGGWVFMSTLNRNLKAYAQAILAAEYILQLLPKGTHDYLRFIKPSELRRDAEIHGLQLRNLRGLTYNPLTKRYATTSSIDVNYLAAFQRLEPN